MQSGITDAHKWEVEHDQNINDCTPSHNKHVWISCESSYYWDVIVMLTEMSKYDDDWSDMSGVLLSLFIPVTFKYAKHVIINATKFVNSMQLASLSWQNNWFKISHSHSLAIETRQSEMANTSPRHMPVLGNVHPIKIENLDFFSWRHFTARSSFYIINWYGYLPKRFPWKIFERNCQSSFWDTSLNCYMLNVAHVTNDVKWRPIVTTFGTLIENMSRTGLYDCHIS